ncbi:MAG: type II secretion system F family protein [Gordonia sp. (in: high G+C Gram-positive bacteria)]|uniref:type II secretion system F family protein n=1 Tax=Gordonia sp. (in: high G+C Gram-positive bacteria) TaxID=84139 RepID=UPI0039E68262
MLTAAASVLGAVALLVWPSHDAARRLRRLTGDAAAGAVRLPVGPTVAAGVALTTATVGIGPGIAAGIVAALVLARRRRSRARSTVVTHSEALIRALSVMSAELSVGAPMVGACRAAAQEVAGRHPEVAAELGRIAARVELGGEVGSATIDDTVPGLRRVGDAWSISVRNGLPMAALLEALRRDLVQRREFGERTEAGMAGPRATATVLAGLPVLGLGLGEMMGAGPVGVLLGSSFGSILLVIGTGLAAAGMLWSDAIVAKVLR